ncbi:uncharacterized protein LOC125203395 [Salvia hispanica]|uniref:uncharacterized protein LOC125203395 n=1 Tax=Salvia hispanica TaxID=49212 RepID=UPI002009605A|nr:uncharacterized protein LOC125203395 [Salvia hispanica]
MPPLRCCARGGSPSWPSVYFSLGFRRQRRHAPHQPPPPFLQQSGRLRTAGEPSATALSLSLPTPLPSPRHSPIGVKSVMDLGCWAVIVSDGLRSLLPESGRFMLLRMMRERERNTWKIAEEDVERLQRDSWSLSVRVIGLQGPNLIISKNLKKRYGLTKNSL